MQTQHFIYHLTNNHSHSSAHFLSHLKFNPQSLIHVAVLTDHNRMLTRKHDKHIPRSQFLWLCWGSTQSSNFKESPILREANIQYICNLLEIQLLKKSNKLDQECVKCNFFSNVHNFAECGWIFTGVVKKHIQVINFKSLHYTKKNLAAQKENVPRYLMSAKTPNIARYSLKAWQFHPNSKLTI